MNAEPKAASGKHWFEEHTGEVELHVEATSLEQLFVEAGLGLADLLADERAGAHSGPELVELEAVDLEALLVEWINELIFRTEKRQEVYDDFRIDGLFERQLRAEIRGVTPAGWRTAVKAATFHRLRIGREGPGYSARVVLDV